MTLEYHRVFTAQNAMYEALAKAMAEAVDRDIMDPFWRERKNFQAWREAA